MKILKTFAKSITVNLNEEERGEAFKHLNLHYFNDERCNIYDEKSNRLVAKYPEIERSNPKIKDAYYKCARSKIIKIKLNLMQDGSLKLAK